MPYFGAGGVAALTRTVQIAGGYNVTVRRLSSGDADYCEGLLTPDKPQIEVTARAGHEPEQRTTMNVEFRRYRTAVLSRGIASWDLDGDDGQIVPVNENTVKGLLDEDADRVFLAIREFNKPLDEDTQGK